MGMSDVLLPQDLPDGPGKTLVFALEPKELTALLADIKEVPLWLCKRIVNSAQGRGLGVEETLFIAVQRPLLLPELLRSGRATVGAHFFEEEHLVVIAESSPEAAATVLSEPSCAAALSQESRRRLHAL